MERLHISRLLPVCFLALSFAVSSVWAVDPSRRIAQYGHTFSRIQDGTFGGEPMAISQTTDGYLWIATLAGLVRFDGVRFVSWIPPDGKRLPSSTHGLTSKQIVTVNPAAPEQFSWIRGKVVWPLCSSILISDLPG